MMTCRLSLLFAALALVGCGGDDPVETPPPADAQSMDTVADSAAQPDLASSDPGGAEDLPPVLDTGEEDAGGEDASVEDTGPPTPTQGARAYVIGPDDTEDLEAGPMASARLGDLVIRNDEVRFVVRGGEHALYMHGLGGGCLVDAGSPHADLLQELVPIVGFHSFAEPTIEITKNGHDGVAEVRVSAEGALPSLIGAWVPILGFEGTITQTYRLETGSRALEMVVESDTPDEVLVGEVMFAAGSLELLVNAKSGWVASEGPEVSYGLLSDDGIDPQEVDSITVFLGPIVAPPISWTRWFIVGDGSMSSVTDQIFELRLDPHGTVAGTVDDKTAQVAAYDPEDVLVTRFRPDETGAFAGRLPVGVFQLRAEGPGRDPGAPVVVEIEDGSNHADLPLSAAAPAGLNVTVDEATRLSIQKSGGGTKATVPIPPGTTAVPIAPGTYTIWAVRGYEYEAEKLEVTLEAGQQTDWAPVLVRSVDTKGWIASEFHVHSEWSADSSVPLTDRVLACAAEGIEYVVSTDHDVVTDYTPFVLPSLAGRIAVASGVEVSTALLGHLNVWPLEANPDLPGHGAPAWHGLEFPELMAALQTDLPGRVVQVNHGRAESSSTFDLIGYKTAAPDPELLSQFTFTAMELFNRGESFEELLFTWFSLRNNGVEVAATGVSDSHSISSLCGNARTFVEVADDNPATVVTTDIDAAVLARRTLMSSGPFLTLAKISGDTVHVRVAGPSWMPVDWIELYVDGVLDQKVAVAAYSNDTVRLDDNVKLTNGGGTWVVAVAGADSVPQPLLTDKVRAVSPVVSLSE